MSKPSPDKIRNEYNIGVYYPGKMLDTTKPLIVLSRNCKSRTIPANKWWINRNTPVGEDADIYERKPYGGNKYINRSDIVGQPVDATVESKQ